MCVRVFDTVLCYLNWAVCFYKFVWMALFLSIVAWAQRDYIFVVFVRRRRRPPSSSSMSPLCSFPISALFLFLLRIKSHYRCIKVCWLFYAFDIFLSFFSLSLMMGLCYVCVSALCPPLWTRKFNSLFVCICAYVWHFSLFFFCKSQWKMKYALHLFASIALNEWMYEWVSWWLFSPTKKPTLTERHIFFRK